VGREDAEGGDRERRTAVKKPRVKKCQVVCWCWQCKDIDAGWYLCFGEPMSRTRKGLIQLSKATLQELYRDGTLRPSRVCVTEL
jgi:hypothetical protein